MGRKQTGLGERMVARRRARDLDRLMERVSRQLAILERLVEMARKRVGLVWRVKSAWSTELVAARTAEEACARYRQLEEPTRKEAEAAGDDTDNLEPVLVELIGEAH